MSNNAVAALTLDDGIHLVSLMGLGAGKTWRDTTLAAWHLPPDGDAWRRLPDVPGKAGRLAGTAVGLAERVFIFGGYTVAEDHTEVSVPLVHALDPVTGVYTLRKPMPVPVDDTVAVAVDGRYIYLISGWHDTGNVNLVQLYDSQTDQWTQATPWPGNAVFGHAGAAAGHTMIVCDGVSIRSTRARRQFIRTPVCLEGRIDADNPARIDWMSMPHHPGPAYYRMAASATTLYGQAAIIFAGGSANPYNYDGIGYNGAASRASADVFAWLVDTKRWRRIGKMPVATMDHRGLPDTGNGLAVIGGMRDPQTVSADVFAIAPLQSR